MDIREALGYSGSNRFVRADQVDSLPANELAFALRASVAECEALTKTSGQVDFEGAYLLRRDEESHAIPIVYLIRVQSEDAGRRVHRFVWNQNQTPFLIVESPRTIRVYTGFAFDPDNDRPLTTVLRTTADELARLNGFRSEAIDSGTIWSEWGSSVDPSKRVDESLLRDLKSLDAHLQDEGLSRAASHALIGKYVYLRYLKDRDILSAKKFAKWEIDPAHIFTTAATLKAFHRLNDELHDWLNGSVFQLSESALDGLTANQLKLVASVFSGGSLVGKDVQRPLFDPYDFSKIPIETLSCVYEQFLHDAPAARGRAARGKKLGAYYTPLPLADFVLSEMQRRRPLNGGARVLDPACGSGIFLAQSFRRLIELRRRQEKRELRPTELREILTSSIFGIDCDQDACRIAELSLIMMLLDYVRPPDLEGSNFKLPALRDRNIFHGDFFEESGKVASLLAESPFDWIVGNPPWAEVARDQRPGHEHHLAFQWIKKFEDSKPTSGNQIAEAFLWKAGQHLTKSGACGLIVPAMTLFKKEGHKFRRRFFETFGTWLLANFANLAEPLFAGRARRPAAVIFFEPGPPAGNHIIQTVAPFVAEQVANRPVSSKKRLFTWNITVGPNDAKELENAIAVRDDTLAWKLAMWGTSRDRRLLERVESRFRGETISQLTAWGIPQPREGPQLRDMNSTEEVEHHPELIGQSTLDMKSLKNCGAIFAFPIGALIEIDARNCFVRKKGGTSLPLEVCKPPHIIVDASRRFAIFSDRFIVVPARQIGIVGPGDSSDVLRILSLLLSSDFCKYHQFFRSPQWGVDASRSDLNALLSLPTPILHMPDDDAKAWLELHNELQSRFERHFNVPSLGGNHLSGVPALLKDLNDRTYRLLGLKKSERWLIEDFVHLNLLMNQGKYGAEIRRPPSMGERKSYLSALRDCLDDFLLHEQGMRHEIAAFFDHDTAVISIVAKRSAEPFTPVVADSDESLRRGLKALKSRVRLQHSQWIYFDRALKIYDRGVLYQLKPLQRLHWTRRQAVLDADDIIAETLSADGPVNDRLDSF